jgi:CHAT domain-containing protein
MARRGGAVLVEYWLGPERSCLWVVAPEGVTAQVLPPEPEIRRLVNTWNRAIQGQRDPVVAAAEAGRSLSRMLLGPAAASVAAHRRMVVVADGILHSLNLETLPAGDGPELWIEKATVSAAPSLSYLAENAGGAAGTAGRRVLLVGDADGAGPEFPRLEFAAQEMNSIKSVLPGYAVTELRQAAATPDAYRAARPGGFDIIHFAAHASANTGSPLDSAVVLSGGAANRKLFTRDVVSTPLAATLVTVSGCRSAGAREYAGEGLVGFAWGFLKAGARNVIAALWDVNDRSTARLMMCVYSQLARGSHPEEALRAAKIDMLRGGGPYAKPFYWAPFQNYTRAVR